MNGLLFALVAIAAAFHLSGALYGRRGDQSITVSAFPFGPGEPYVLRVSRHEGFAVTPPDSDRETIDLPPINEDIL